MARQLVDTEYAHLIVELSWAWRLIGPALFLVAAAYPLLVTYIEMRALGRGDVLPPLVILMIGLMYSWYCSHTVTVTDGGVVFRSWARRSIVHWAELDSFKSTTNWLIVRAATGAKYRVSAYARGVVALEDRLRKEIAATAGKSLEYDRQSPLPELHSVPGPRQAERGGVMEDAFDPDFPSDSPAGRPDLRAGVATLLEDVARLLGNAAALIRAEGAAPATVLFQEAPRERWKRDGDPLPDGPRIDTPGLEGLGTPATKPNAHGHEDERLGVCFGPSIRIFFNPSGKTCKQFDVLQLSKLKVEVWDPSGPAWREHPDTHDWDVDGETNATDPTNGTAAPTQIEKLKPLGLIEFGDTPGTPWNPWTSPFMRGRRFRYTHDFETYLVCLDPYTVLGFYTWRYVMEVTIGTDRASSGVTYPDPDLAPSSPQWNPGLAGGNLEAGLEAWNKEEAKKWLPQ